MKLRFCLNTAAFESKDFKYLRHNILLEPKPRVLALSVLFLSLIFYTNSTDRLIFFIFGWIFLDFLYILFFGKKFKIILALKEVLAEQFSSARYTYVYSL